MLNFSVEITHIAYGNVVKKQVVKAMEEKP